MSVWARARGLLKELEPGEGMVEQAYRVLEHRCNERARADPATAMPLIKEWERFVVVYDNETGDTTECTLEVRYREQGQPIERRGR